MLQNPPTMQETQETLDGSLGWEDPLEEGMVTLSSILAWENLMERSLECRSLWGHKESDRTEHIHTHKTNSMLMRIIH